MDLPVYVVVDYNLVRRGIVVEAGPDFSVVEYADCDRMIVCTGRVTTPNEFIFTTPGHAFASEVHDQLKAVSSLLKPFE